MTRRKKYKKVKQIEPFTAVKLQETDKEVTYKISDNKIAKLVKNKGVFYCNSIAYNSLLNSKFFKDAVLLRKAIINLTEFPDRIYIEETN